MEDSILKILGDFLRKLFFTVKDRNKQVPTENSDSISSFVNTASEMEAVYRIRDSIFGTSELSGRSYDHLLNKNRFAIKLLKYQSDSGISSSIRNNSEWAYYSMIPISVEDYDSFLRNELSHKEVIKNSLDWNTALSNELVYIYIVGIVVTKDVWQKPLKSSYAVADMADFLYEVIKRLGPDRIGGLTGYPSRKEGKQIFNKARVFKSTGLYKENDELQELLYCPKDRVKYLLEELEQQRSSAAFSRYQEKVFWNDKIDFIEQLA